MSQPKNVPNTTARTEAEIGDPQRAIDESGRAKGVIEVERKQLLIATAIHYVAELAAQMPAELRRGFDLIMVIHAEGGADFADKVRNGATFFKERHAAFMLHANPLITEARVIDPKGRESSDLRISLHEAPKTYSSLDTALDRVRTPAMLIAQLQSNFMGCFPDRDWTVPGLEILGPDGRPVLMTIPERLVEAMHVEKLLPSGKWNEDAMRRFFGLSPRSEGIEIAGVQSLEHAVISRSLEGMLKTVIQARGYPATLDIAPGLQNRSVPRPVMDPVVMEYLKNARDEFGMCGKDPRDCHLRVSVGRSSSGVELTIAIADNGRGIPEDVLARWGLGGITHKGARGSGQGLEINVKIIESLGGRVDVDTRRGGPDSGTTITITLPFERLT